jgi:hypothetical protein
MRTKRRQKKLKKNTRRKKRGGWIKGSLDDTSIFRHFKSRCSGTGLNKDTAERFYKVCCNKVFYSDPNNKRRENCIRAKQFINPEEYANPAQNILQYTDQNLNQREAAGVNSPEEYVNSAENILQYTDQNLNQSEDAGVENTNTPREEEIKFFLPFFKDFLPLKPKKNLIYSLTKTAKEIAKQTKQKNNNKITEAINLHLQKRKETLDKMPNLTPDEKQKILSDEEKLLEIVARRILKAIPKEDHLLNKSIKKPISKKIYSSATTSIPGTSSLSTSSPFITETEDAAAKDASTI